MAAATDTNAKAGSKGGLVITIAALTVLAVIGGGLVGKLVVARLRGAPAAAASTAPAPTPYAGNTEVRELTPIITNLADPASARVRLQVAIVFPRPAVVDEANLLAANITDDLVAFVKTLSLTQLQGASGLQDLREDLAERAAVRSQGKVREVVIEALVVQ